MHVIDFLKSFVRVRFVPSMKRDGEWVASPGQIILYGFDSNKKSVAVLIVLLHELGHAWHNHHLSIPEAFGFSNPKLTYRREQEAWSWAKTTLRELGLLGKYGSWFLKIQHAALQSYTQDLHQYPYTEPSKVQIILQEADQILVTSVM